MTHRRFWRHIASTAVLTLSGCSDGGMLEEDVVLGELEQAWSKEVNYGVRSDNGNPFEFTGSEADELVLMAGPDCSTCATTSRHLRR
jgi:hypothetical protein